MITRCYSATSGIIERYFRIVRRELFKINLSINIPSESEGIFISYPDIILFFEKYLDLHKRLLVVVEVHWNF